MNKRNKESIALSILRVLSSAERKKVVLIFTLFVLSSFLEVVSIVSIFPLISLLSDPSLVETNIHLKTVYERGDFESFNSFAFFMAGCVLVANVVSIAIRSMALYVNLQFCYRSEYTISLRLTKLFLGQTYEWNLNRNSSSLSKTVLAEVHQYIHKGLGPLIVLFAQSLVIMGILIMLALTNLIATISSAILLGVFYFIVARYSKNNLKKVGDIRVEANDQRFRFLSEILTSVKEIKLSQTDHVFLNKFRAASNRYAASNIYAGILGVLPRFAIEWVVVSAIIIVLMFLLHSGTSLIEILPTLSLFVFALARMLPAAQQCYASVTAIRFNTPTVMKLLEDIDAAEKGVIPPHEPWTSIKEDAGPEKFEELKIERLGFSYSNTSKPSLEDVDFKICAGEKIGIIGQTGSGKTTLINIILGLLYPQKGSISINGEVVESWHSWKPPLGFFGYVPQNVVLLDADLRANIAFGLAPEEAPDNEIQSAIDAAELSSFLSTLSDGLSTNVGENGAKLSGGQRQRIGIARALLKKPRIVVLDEGTSALDQVTEEAVMSNIDGITGNCALLVVAHRLSTVKNCDRIYVLNEGKLQAVGSYAQLQAQNIILA